MKLRVNHSNKLSTKLISFLPMLKASIEEIEESAFQIEKENPFLEVKSNRFLTFGSYVKNSSTEFIENLTLNSDSLYDSLIFQIENSKLFPTQKSQLIAKEIIKDIDSMGFFSGNESEIADYLGFDVEEVKKVRNRFRYLEPSGVGAKDKVENFLFQLDNLDIDDNLYNFTKELILNLDSIENYSNKEFFFEALKIIKSFRLSPAFEFQKDEFVIPDIIVLNRDGNLEVKLNDEFYPVIEIKDVDIDNKEYRNEKLKEAKNLIDAMEMRKATLYKIGLMIVELQYDFFMGGEMRPMKLLDVAEELGFAQSTISRAISNKYILYDGGVVPIKNFFSTAVEDVSSSQIKIMLKNLIENEDTKKPLNDEKLTEEIKKEFNIKIVRRTISKYRESLNIPSSRERKRIYKLRG